MNLDDFKSVKGRMNIEDFKSVKGRMNLEDFKAAVMCCLRQKYVDFNGRAKRGEYWYFFLFQVVVSFPLFILQYAWSSLGLSALVTIFSIICGLFILATILPGLSVAVRRLHDINKSGWFVLISFIPLIGAIVLLYLLAQQGTEGPNKYGDA